MGRGVLPENCRLSETATAENETYFTVNIL